MKNSILIIGMVVLSILNMHATNEKMPLNPSTELTENNIAQVFEWEVKTNKSEYAGTALSLKQAERMIALSSSGEIVRDQKITSYFILKSDVNTNENRNYFWEVKTATATARGYSSSEAYAHKMIALVASGDVIVDKIIISQPQQ
ncbi:hypothetical protein [Algibacter pacificus]|uniref:hypothetical protein n=1 Tax=Algibacter pacificus TaxID=2599389 RepID=UPI0011CA2333|nr:hypothetical protein [Algibacter pacificus]